MIQLSLSLYAVTQESSAVQTPEILKAGLREHIKITGLSAYKDFYMKVKRGEILSPEGISQENYLTMAREVYELRAAELERQKNRRKYFAIKNRPAKKS